MGEIHVRIISQDVANGLSFVDIADRDTVLTAAAVGDVIMTITFRAKTWVRVGNIITGRGDATARALITALALRVAANEQLTSDIDRIVDGVTWANAPAAEAQFAVFTADSTVGQKISLTDRTALDPATDIPGNTQWVTVLNPIPADREILIRVATGLPPVDFQMAIGSSNRPVHSYELRASDATWDYYGGGGIGSTAVAGAVQKRVERFHTAWHGDLAGRALAQLNEKTDIDQVRDEFVPFVDIEPGYYVRGGGPQKFHAIIAGAPKTGYPDTDSIRIIMRGITLHTEAWEPVAGSRVIDFEIDATEAANLDRNIAANSDTERLEFWFRESGAQTLQLVRELPIRDVRDGKFRTLAGASPYTVLLTDTEFVVWVNHTDDNVDYPIFMTRNRLGTAPKNFGAVQNNITDTNHNWYGVSANLNAVGTGLTIVEAGSNMGQWTIEAVEAK